MESRNGIIINSQVIGLKRFKKIRIRCCIEAVIYIAAICLLISLIPFVERVQMIVSVCVSLAVLVLTIIGYKGQTPSEFLINCIREKKYNHNYHLRSINDEDQGNLFQGTVTYNTSIADRVIQFIKERKEAL